MLLMSASYVEVSESLRLLRRIFRKMAQMFALAEAAKEDDWYRASGDVECEACGELYYSHAHDPREPWMTLLCGGKRVKL